MKSNRLAPETYAVTIEALPTGFDWKVTSADGRTVSGRATNRGSARRCCDFTIATLEAFQRLGRRTF